MLNPDKRCTDFFLAFTLRQATSIAESPLHLPSMYSTNVYHCCTPAVGVLTNKGDAKK